MIIKITLTPSDLNKSIDFEDAILFNDFDLNSPEKRRLIHAADIIEFVNDKGDVIKEFKNRFGGTKIISYIHIIIKNNNEKKNSYKIVKKNIKKIRH